MTAALVSADNVTGALPALVEAWLEANLAGGALLVPVPQVNSSIGPSGLTGTASNSNQFATTFQGVVPFVISKEITIDQLLCHIGTADAAATVGMALWSSNADGMPTTRIASGTATPAATGILAVTLGSPVVLDPGIYWAGFAASSITTLRVTGALVNLFNESVPGGYSGLPSGGGRTWQLNAGGAYNAPAASIASYALSGASNTAWIGYRRSA
jgi:hypothetical protein